ncbi:MAG TPA: hypothetical protein VEJ38_02185 [Candidatus Acidoferrales bacterium]|nr:hypothetical protein [Candidatus Acidoferrales bacterium]
MNRQTRDRALSSLVLPALALVAFLAFSRPTAQAAQASTATPPTPMHASALQVLQIQAEDVKLPAEFQMAMYEHVMEEVGKTRRFEHLYRDGDRDAASAPDLVTLRCTATGFKQGSAEKRQVTTVTGKTSIKVHLLFTDKNGQKLFENDVEGKVQFLGENLRATFDFGKKVAAVVRQDFTPAKSAKKS